MEVRLDELCDTELDPLFWTDERCGLLSEWWVQVPFAHWVVRATRPGKLVDLGTGNGMLFAAFCQAARRDGLDTRCIAVDQWDGDDAQFHDELASYVERHGLLSATLLRGSFDSACREIADGSVDLLHVATADHHVFEVWLAKLSERAVVMLQDIATAASFWDALTTRFPSFVLPIGLGLGVLAVGKIAPSVIVELCAQVDPDVLARFHGRLARIGECWQAEGARSNGQVAKRVTIQEARAAELEDRLAALRAAAHEQAMRTAALEQARDAANQQVRELRARAMQVRAQLARVRTQLTAEEQARRDAEAELAELRHRHELVLGSTIWRATRPLRLVGGLLPAKVRRVLGVVAQRGRLPAELQMIAPPPKLRANVQSGVPTPPSELFRAKDPSWVSPAERPDFLALRNLRPRGRIAVVAHIYYVELWPEISAAIGNLAEPFDLFVTLVSGAADLLAPTIQDEWPGAYVMTVDNHGRDIVPFMEIIRTGALFRYELVCKLHTKRSFWHEDGEKWRQSLIAGVLGNPAIARAVPAAFRADSALGLVVADGHVYSGPELWIGNERHLTRLIQSLGLNSLAFDKSFAGGSIYWIRSDLLRHLDDLPLTFDDFEAEPLSADGSMAHAVERIVSLICYHSGTTIRQTGAVLDALGAGAESV
jgi:hypothetical protein